MSCYQCVLSEASKFELALFQTIGDTRRGYVIGCSQGTGEVILTMPHVLSALSESMLNVSQCERPPNLSLNVPQLLFVTQCKRPLNVPHILHVPRESIIIHDNALDLPVVAQRSPTPILTMRRLDAFCLYDLGTHAITSESRHRPAGSFTILQLLCLCLFIYTFST